MLFYKIAFYCVVLLQLLLQLLVLSTVAMILYFSVSFYSCLLLQTLPFRVTIQCICHLQWPVMVYGIHHHRLLLLTIFTITLLLFMLILRLVWIASFINIFFHLKFFHDNKIPGILICYSCNMLKLAFYSHILQLHVAATVACVADLAVHLLQQWTSSLTNVSCALSLSTSVTHWWLFCPHGVKIQLNSCFKLLT